MFSGLGGHNHGLMGLGISQQDYLNQMAMQQAAAQNSPYWASAQMGAMQQNTAPVNHNSDEQLLVLLTEE